MADGVFSATGQVRIMIHIIGIGVDGKKSLTARALAAIDGATLLVGGARHLDEFGDSGAEKAVIKGGLEGVAAIIKEHIASRKGASVAVLATGDPFLFGIGGFIVKKFGKRSVEVMPNVSTVQEAFARIKTDWGGVKILSAHGRGASVEDIARQAARREKLAIFTDPDNTPAKIAGALIKKGMDGRRAYVCESLGTAKERTTEYSLAALARRKSFHPLNILLLIRDGEAKSDGAVEPLFGLPDSSFVHTCGMITKEEIRVVALSKLALRRDSVLWDIGAGCGSVAVEAARLASAGAVLAVEKDAARVSQIEKNRKRFNLDNLTVVHGEAPGCMEGLKLGQPDAVFIGGGGTGITGIMRYASKRLKKGGRMVVNAVTLETAHGATEHLRRIGWKWEAVMINLSRSRGIGGLNMLGAHNPVFVISGAKP